MLLSAYTVYDNKALTYSPPFFVASDGAAVRMLKDLVTDPNTSIGRHPSDYILYGVGTYNDQNGLFDAALPIRHVMDAIALVPIQADLFTDARTPGIVDTSTLTNGKAL